MATMNEKYSYQEAKHSATRSNRDTESDYEITNREEEYHIVKGRYRVWHLGELVIIEAFILS